MTNSTDTRDLRDPQKLGDVLLKEKQLGAYEAETLSEAYDKQVALMHVPNYPKHDSVGSQTAREYRQELQERADAGDRYALSMLKGMPYDEPGDV